MAGATKFRMIIFKTFLLFLFASTVRAASHGNIFSLKNNDPGFRKDFKKILFIYVDRFIRCCMENFHKYSGSDGLVSEKFFLRRFVKGSSSDK